MVPISAGELGGRWRRGGWGVRGAQQLDDVGDPRCGVALVGAVDVDACGQPGCAQRFEPLVEQLAGVAEQVVADVPESQYSEAQVVERDIAGCE